MLRAIEDAPFDVSCSDRNKPSRHYTNTLNFQGYIFYLLHWAFQGQSWRHFLKTFFSKAVIFLESCSRRWKDCEAQGTYNRNYAVEFCYLLQDGDIKNDWAHEKEKKSFET